MGDAPLPSQHLPSQALLPRAAPAPRDAPSSAAPAPRVLPALWDHGGHMAGAAPALLTRIRAVEGGREQLGCHGGEEAAEGETFPGREESVGGRGQGLPGSPRPGAGGNISARFGGGGATSASRWRELGEGKTSSPLHPYGCRAAGPSSPSLIAPSAPHGVSWAVLSSHLWLAQGPT